MENTINQTKNNIKEELEKGSPSASKILSYLTSLRIYEEGLEFDPKDEWRYLPDNEFFDIVGETFKLNPKFYMKKLYLKVRRNLFKDMKKRKGKFYGVDKQMEMEKYIIENFCLNDGEQILFESSGTIEYFEEGGILKKKKENGVIAVGTLFVTNYRIIAQGITMPLGSFSFRKRIINYSLEQKCYGYIFPIKNLSNLIKKSKGVTYDVNVRNIRIRIIDKVFLTDRQKKKREEAKNKLFEILSKHSTEEVKYLG